MTEEEKRFKRITAIGEIHTAGFNIVHRHSSTAEPMLMGGYEYIARRGSYLLVYNLTDENICLQKNESNYVDWEKPFVIKYLPFNKFTETLGLTIALEIGLDFYNGL